MDGYIQQRLRHFKAIGVKRVRAKAGGRDDECKHCKALDGLVYNIDEFPEYPPRGCTCTLGCGCMVARVEYDDVLQIAVGDNDRPLPGGREVSPTASGLQADAPSLPGDGSAAKESWSLLVSSAHQTKSSARQLVRNLGICTALLVRRGAARCMELTTTAIPVHAKRISGQSAFVIRKYGKPLATRASITLTALAIKRHMKAIGYSASVDWFGAYHRDPGQLMFWVRVDTDREKEKLEGNPRFWDKLRTYLKSFGYPKEGRDRVFFGIESQETIRRQAERIASANTVRFHGGPAGAPAVAASGDAVPALRNAPEAPAMLPGPDRILHSFPTGRRDSAERN